jgi:glycosyltransferase involved in cell wall biosynthesis
MNAETTKKIKVCFVAPKAYPIFNPAIGNYFGGAEVDLYYLATELAKDGNFEVSFIVADYDQKDIEFIENVTVIKSVNFSKNMLSGLLRTWSTLKKADADIYFLKCASPGTPVVAAFCKLYRRIFLYRLASVLESNGVYIKQHPVLGRLFAASLRQAAMVFAQNSADRENLTKTLSLPSRMLPNGHPLPPLRQQPKDMILWVGRDEDVKRPERFLDLAKSLPDERFIMICQTLNNSSYYQNIVEQAGKIANLEFLRHVPFNLIDTYFRRAKVLVNTSDSEGFPNTFIQACKAGAAILSFNVNPDSFLDTCKCGLCCNGDAERLKYNLRLMLENNLYVEFGSNGRKYVEQNHDIIKIAAEYKNIFNKLIKNT